MTLLTAVFVFIAAFGTLTGSDTTSTSNRVSGRVTGIVVDPSDP